MRLFIRIWSILCVRHCFSWELSVMSWDFSCSPHHADLVVSRPPMWPWQRVAQLPISYVSFATLRFFIQRHVMSSVIWSVRRDGDVNSTSSRSPFASFPLGSPYSGCSNEYYASRQRLDRSSIDAKRVISNTSCRCSSFCRFWALWLDHPFTCSNHSYEG